MGKRILVVDDDPVIRSLVGDYLTTFGHSVETLEDGASCLLRLENDPPQLVFLDLQLPDMTGIEVLTKLRVQEGGADIPVVLLSANEDSGKLTEDKNLGNVTFLHKPFDFKAMLRLVESAS